MYTKIDTRLTVILFLAIAVANGKPLVTVGNVIIGNTIEQKQQ